MRPYRTRSRTRRQRGDSHRERLIQATRAAVIAGAAAVLSISAVRGVPAWLDVVAAALMIGTLQVMLTSAIAAAKDRRAVEEEHAGRDDPPVWWTLFEWQFDREVARRDDVPRRRID